MTDKQEKKDRRKLILDIVMSMLLVLVMNVKLTGMVFHETVGLFVGFLFMFHTVLNFSWIKAVFSSWNNGKIKRRSRFMLILDIVLIILVFLIILSGICISQEVLPIFNIGNTFLWKAIHVLSSRLAFILIIIHIGLHKKRIVSGIRKMFKLSSQHKKTSTTNNANNVLYKERR